jgi:hypothetical protein
MSELEKRRGARDVWISRSHVAAAGSGAVLLSGISFLIGVWLGVGRSVHHLAEAGVEHDANESARLVQLLARVETAADLDGGVGQLTFPEELAGTMVGPDAPLPGILEHERVAFVLQADSEALASADRAPTADDTVVEIASSLSAPEALSLRDRVGHPGVDIRAIPALVGGVASWSVVAVFRNEVDAAAWKSNVGSSLD